MLFIAVSDHSLGRFERPDSHTSDPGVARNADHPAWQLRAEFARRLSRLYGREVPAYTTLLEESHAVNNAVLRGHGADAGRLGSISRVPAISRPTS